MTPETLEEIGAWWVQIPLDDEEATSGYDADDIEVFDSIASASPSDEAFELDPDVFERTVAWMAAMGITGSLEASRLDEYQTAAFVAIAQEALARTRR